MNAIPALSDSIRKHFEGYYLFVILIDLGADHRPGYRYLCTYLERSFPGNSCRPISAKMEMKNKVNIKTSVIIFIDFSSVFTMAFKPETKEE